MEELKEFKNKYTQISDNGIPKVQSMTKSDLDGVYGSEIQDEAIVTATKFNDLLAIPSKDKSGQFSSYWLATAWDDEYY